ncbi:MAG: formylglycine-generating enzyme family protein [Verrucomicrobiales bacterium]|nr:formylglycine-generating enzyme family protein [Verrucomicrobiales bacterium]
MQWIGAPMLAALLASGIGCDRPDTRADTHAPRPGADQGPTAGLTPLTNMVRLPAGSFQRLDQRVTLTHDFWISRFEVTQDDYRQLIGANPSGFPGDGSRPVEKVSWVEATAYCEALTRQETAAGRLPAGYVYRLPTEAEWEYACRAGSTNRFSFGDRDEDAAAHAWTQENSEMAPHPVGRKQPNARDLYDMHGNVWEWCADWYADYSGNAVTNPVGPATGKFKVFRGGGWNNEAKFARCSNRFMMEPSNGIHFVGFRVALGLEPPKPAAVTPAQSTNQPSAITP